ncbi:MAG: hypothetical protein HY272_11110 [Gammaproteobacteria bacterium]|nr:hypothetical protein [Gammaproteobacteria bacterium]
MKYSAIVFIFAITTAIAYPSFAAPRDVSASTSIEVRLDYVEKLMQSRSGQRLQTHKGGKAYKDAQKLIAAARAALQQNQRDKADKLTRQGLTTFMAGVRDMPDDPEEIERMKNRFNNLRTGLEKFVYAQTDNRQRIASEKGVSSPDYNKSKVAELMSYADIDAAEGDYEKAIARLTEAQTIVTASIQGMLNHSTLVSELDVSTPEKEYFYELRRYLGYEELIPVAIEVKRPAAPLAEQMKSMGEKAKWMAEQARLKAIEKNYPVAIRMMLDATSVVREALKMADVDM